MHFIMIAARPDIAAFAAARGVDWIMVDLEQLGKAERQGHLDTVMSQHNVADIAAVRPVVPPGRLLVRTNPLHSGSAAELDAVIAAGADWVMQPFFHSAREVADYAALVAGRAAIMLLAETVGAADQLGECCKVPGVARVHIGLNDLSLERGLAFMFELMADGTVERMAAVLNSCAMPFGIGGVARAGEGLLPAEAILAEHARLGSDAAILSRTFHRQATSVAAIVADMDFAGEIAALRAAMVAARAASLTEQAARHERFVAAIAAIARDRGPRAVPSPVRAGE